jgi:two-component system response regulator
MKEKEEKVLLLIVDDDEDDFFIMNKALSKSGFNCEIERLTDGKELLEYLACDTSAMDGKICERPVMILMDLNMPRMDGREALKKIKEDTRLRDIPVIIFTTSNSEQDIQNCYKLGANSYIQKPADFNTLVNCFTILGTYWFQTVDLPVHQHPRI